MGKKRPAILILIIFLSIPVFTFAETISTDSELFSNLAEAPADGIFKLGEITIKFIPPKGWGMLKQDSSNEYNGIQFMASDSMITSLGISVRPFPSVSSGSGTKASLENMLKEEASKDPSVSEQRMIKFADTDAATLITKSGTIKTKQIQFFKGINMFIISFIAEDQDFDKFLPVVEESLRSFEVITPVSQKESVSKKVYLDPSKALYDKFQTLSEKITSEALKSATEQGLVKVPEESLSAMIKEGSSQLMVRFHDAFVVSDAEAQKILNGGCDDISNSENVKNYISEFMKLQVILPGPIVFLIEKLHENSLSSLELEFTARLFKEYLKQMKSNPKVKEQFK